MAGENRDTPGAQGDLWMFRPLLSAVLILALAGCVSVTEAPPGVTVDGTLPPDVKSAVIVAAPAGSGAIRNAGTLTDVPRLFALSVRDALEKKRPDWRLRIDESGRDPADRDLTITTEILDIDGGSAGLRFWIGFGAGAAEARARITLLDRAGKAIASAEIAESAICPLGVCGDSNEEMIQAGLQRLAAEAADFIVDPAGYRSRKQSKP